jgi:hypothetical protein
MAKPGWQDIFIAALGEMPNIRRACRLAGISRKHAYLTRRADVEFDERWKIALKESTEMLEEEAWRRAQLGTAKPVFQQGTLVGHVQEYSDTLMIFLLKAHKPKKYREVKQLMHSSPTGGPVEMTVEDMETVRKRRWAETQANLATAMSIDEAGSG